MAINSDHILKISQAQEIMQAFAGKADDRFLKVADAGALATKDDVAYTDLAQALKDILDGKADAATTLAGYGITDAMTATQIREAIASSVSAAYKPGGSVAAVGDLPTLAAGVLGYVYNFTAAFVTTADFVEGAGSNYPAGTNVVVVDVDTTGENPSYKFDVLAGSYGNATQTGAGLMSASDKTKLDGIEDEANKYIHPTYTAQTGPETADQTPAFGATFDISQVTSDTSGHVTGVVTRKVTIPNAAAVASTGGTGGSAGLLSAVDKEKLDGFEFATASEVQTVIDSLFA